MRRVAGDDLAAGVALELEPAADPEVAADREEPAGDALGVGDGVPDVIDAGGKVRRSRTVRPSPAAIRPVPTSRCTASIWWMTSIIGGSPSGCRGWGCGGGGGEAAFPPAPGELGGERVQALLPEPVEGLEPRIDLLERLGADGVQAAGAVGSDRREPAVAQDPEVLRHGRLGDAELGLDDRGDRAGWELAVGQELEDPPPHRVAEDVERVHVAEDISPRLYKSTMEHPTALRWRAC